MKKSVILTLTALVVFACGDKKADTETIIKSGNIAQIKAHREVLQQQFEKMKSEVEQLDNALAQLEPNTRKVLVKAYTVIDTLFIHHVDIQGSVETRENVVITPEMNGILTQLLVKPGQNVTKGQLLGRVDDGGLSAQLAQVQSQLTLAQTAYERQSNLWQQKIGSEMQYLQAKTNFENAEKAVKQMQSMLAKTNIRAPFNGTIENIQVEKGQVVNASTALMRIVNTQDMYVKADIPESYIGKIKTGDTVQINVRALGKTFTGKVRQVGNFINPNNRSFTIEVGVNNNQNLLKPNQVAVVKLVDYINPKALLIPENTLIQSGQGQTFVYVLEGSGTEAIASRREVKLGLNSNALIEVIEGLSSGERIISEGARTVNEADKVQIIK